MSQSKLALISDACLTEVLKFLPRDDIDQLPTVGRRFRRVLSYPYFQSTPRRVLSSYWQSSRAQEVTVLSSMVQQYPRFFAQLTFAKYGQGNRTKQFHCHLPELVELLDQSPWLRCKEVTICVDDSTMDNMTLLLSIRQFWEGGQLVIFARRPNRSSGRTLNLRLLAGDCSSLKLIRDHIGKCTNFSLVDWDIAGNQTCSELTLYCYLYGLTLEQLVNDFLIPDNGVVTKKRLSLLEFKFSDDVFRVELVEAVKKRFLSIKNPNCFELRLTWKRGRNAQAHSIEEVEVVEHPNPFVGQCSIILDEPLTVDGTYTIKMNYQGRGQQS